MIYFFILFIYDLYFTFYLVYVLFLFYLICIELLSGISVPIIFYYLISGISIDIGSFPIAGMIFSRKSLNLTLAEHVLSPT